MVCLPDLSSLPLCQCYDPTTENLQDLTYPDGLQPCRIHNYVIDPADWQPEARTCGNSSSKPLGSSPSDGVKSRADILAHMVNNEEPCHICGSQGTACFGESCVRTFQSRTEKVERNGKLCIETPASGGNFSMGYGVFTGTQICMGEIVGEYLGRLLPLDWDTKRDQVHSYSFELENVGVVDASEYGNITRFINHRCKPNLDVEFITYGRRRCIAFAANRDITPGELFIHYCDDYFGKSKPCLCDVALYPHIPPKGSERPTKVPELD